jgi:1-deoxy-D-xylulose-5-phosphate reductoisomerase
MSARLRIAVLGSTGSIGTQTLAVATRERERVEVVALAAGSALDTLCAQAREFRPRAVALECAADHAAARRRLAEAAPGAEVIVGAGAAARIAADVECDTVVHGIVGAAGLRASLAALGAGRRLALANKETLVVGGALVRGVLARGGEIVPVDSEHSAALQAIGGRPAREIARLTLTASGGALRAHPDWRRATREEVLAHPVWPMGRRITVDSALLANKGLEIIEAHWLFDLPFDRLDAVIHPEALVHALVTFTDGSTVVQAARPDMALPIQLALSWPERWGAAVPALEPASLAGLRFEPIARGLHPVFDLALDAARAGGTAPCAFNAADEAAVQAFLDGAIPLGGVPDAIARVLDAHAPQPVESIEQLESVDTWARAAVRDATVGA